MHTLGHCRRLHPSRHSTSSHGSFGDLGNAEHARRWKGRFPSGRVVATMLSATGGRYGRANAPVVRGRQLQVGPPAAVWVVWLGCLAPVVAMMSGVMGTLGWMILASAVVALGDLVMT